MTKPAARSRKTAPHVAGDPGPSIRLAAIDIGSNSIHMIVAQADADGAVTTLWRMKEPVGLGRISFPSKNLSAEAVNRAVAVLARFKQAAQQRSCEKVIAVATSAVREAENGGDLIQRVKRELGLYVKVVSAREEARLIYLAVRHALDLRDRPHLIVDIGGGSVEFVVGDQHKAHVLESRKLGAARMTAKFVRSDPISPDERKALHRQYERELAPLLEQVRRLKPARAIGTSGTLENLAAMCGGTAADAAAQARSDGGGSFTGRRRPRGGSSGSGSSGGTASGGDAPGDGPASPGPITGVIERKPLDKLVGRLVESTSKQRASIRGLDDQRKDQVVAGALLVKELFDRLDLKRIYVCGAALREGILLDYLARHMPDLAIRREVPDPRRRSVIDLARRCDWHRAHSEQVTRLCLSLFDELRPLHGLGPIDRELIEYAALLHDIGWHIAGRGHHKHSMYLISHGHLRNFEPEEVQVIANIARYHRKRPPTKEHEAYAALSSRARRVVDVGAALLRVADGLDRSHASAVRSLACRRDDKRVRVILTPRGDVQLEIWGARQKREWFEEVFGRKIEFVTAVKR